MDINSAAAALVKKNFADVKRYIEEGGDINARDDLDNYTLLMRAAEKTVGYTDMIGYLVEAGADLEAKNDAGASALALVTERMDVGPGLSICEDITITDNGSLDEAILDSLLETLGTNTEEHYVIAARLLLEAGADVTVSNSKGQRPLRVAAVASAAMLREILKYDKDIECVDDDGFTPLQAAAGKGWSTKNLEVLVDAGANLHSVDAYGFTPLHQAVLADKARSVEWLLKLGANPNIGITRGYDSYNVGDTAIDCAIKLRNRELMALFD